MAAGTLRVHTARTHTRARRGAGPRASFALVIIIVVLIVLIVIIVVVHVVVVVGDGPSTALAAVVNPQQHRRGPATDGTLPGTHKTDTQHTAAQE